MCTLAFAVYCLSQNPSILATLREEILMKVGPTRRPTFEDIKNCKYLRAVINGLYICNEFLSLVLTCLNLYRNVKVIPPCVS